MTFGSELIPLSPECLAALDAVDRFIADHAYGPSLQEIAELSGVRSFSSVRFHILRLEGLHLITLRRVGFRSQIASHTIRLTPKGRRVLEMYRRGGAH